MQPHSQVGKAGSPPLFSFLKLFSFPHLHFACHPPKTGGDTRKKNPAGVMLRRDMLWFRVCEAG
jgi:hypothetical protein